MTAELDFAQATAVEHVSGSAGVYRADVTKAFWIIFGPNGGFVAAVMARACLAELSVRGSEHRLGAVTLHFLRAPEIGAVEIAVDVVKLGRRTGSLAVKMSQGGRLVVHGIVTTVRPDPGAPTSFRDRTAPGWVTGPVPPALPDAPESGIAMRERYDTRPMVGGRFLELVTGAPGPVDVDGSSVDIDGSWRAATDAASDDPPALAGGFIRPRPAAVVDECLLVAMADAWWPPIFERRVAADLAVPTAEFTVHVVHPLPRTDDFVAALFYSATTEAGFTVEDGRIWDRTGRELARCRQIAVVS